MEDFRSKSCREGRMQIENKAGPTNMQDLRSYSVSYAGSVQQNQPNKEAKMKKSKSKSKSKSNNIGPSCKNGWSLKDAELQRRTRVAGYKVYAVEGKMKGSLRKSCSWIKNTYTQLLYGWR